MVAIGAHASSASAIWRAEAKRLVTLRESERITTLLGNRSFTDKAKLEVIERERAKLSEFQSKRQQLQERLNDLA